MDDRLSCTEVIPCEKLFLDDSENIVPEDFFFQNDNNVKEGCCTLVEIDESKDDVLFGDVAEINPMNASNISNENPMNSSNISLGTAALENATAEVFHDQNELTEDDSDYEAYKEFSDDNSQLEGVKGVEPENDSDSNALLTCSSNDEAYNNKDSTDVAVEQVLDSFAPINFDNLGPFYSPYNEVIIPEQNEIIPEQNDDVFLETAFYTDSARKVFEQSNLTINELREMEKRGDVKRTGGRGKDFKGTKFVIENIKTAKKLKKEKMRSKEAKMWKEGDAKLQSYFSEESKKICYNTFIKYHDDHDRIAKIGLALGGKRSRRKFLKFFSHHIF